MLPRNHWRRQHDRLDPVRDKHQIIVNLSTREFPWDTLNALSFALFRTYAVPSVGVLLHDTGEFTERVQKRYDDTGILLEEILENSLSSARGRDAVRRINQMHAMYDIPNDDLRYVLATFVVVPRRWIERFGYRPMTRIEVEAATNYYLELGRHMAVKDLPEDYAGFERLLDDYERAHFAYDPRARKVADATLDLMTTFPPTSWLPAFVAKRFAYSLMDDTLLAAFRYRKPPRIERAVYLTGMKVRQILLRRLPARSKPRWTRDFGYFRCYPAGYEIDRLGTFPGGAGCPVHVTTESSSAVAG